MTVVFPGVDVIGEGEFSGGSVQKLDSLSCLDIGSSSFAGVPGIFVDCGVLRGGRTVGRTGVLVLPVNSASVAGELVNLLRRSVNGVRSDTPCRYAARVGRPAAAIASSPNLFESSFAKTFVREVFTPEIANRGLRREGDVLRVWLVGGARSVLLPLLRRLMGA